MSSPSKLAVELCALLVNETYGDLTSRIFTILLRRGRLPIPSLCKHTKLSPRQCRHGLVVLIQQDLVYYHLDTDTKVTCYEANQGAAYKLVRSGKIVEIAESRYGAPAKEIITNLLQLGHTTVVELVAAYKALGERPVNGNSHESIAANGANGVQASDKVKSMGHLYAILYQLLKAGLIEPVDERSFRSPTDTYNMVEREVLKEGGEVKGVKGKLEHQAKISRRLKAIRDEVPDWQPTVGNKRTLNGDWPNGLNGAAKKRRLANGAVNGDHEYLDVEFEMQLTLRINYEKFSVAMRNQRLVELAKLRLGETTSQVYAQVLLMLEPTLPRCRRDPAIDGSTLDGAEVATVSTADLLNTLSQSIDLASGIGKTGKASAAHSESRNIGKTEKSKKRAVEEADTMDLDDDDIVPRSSKRPKVTFEDEVTRSENLEEHQSRTVQLKNHLALLANDQCGFLKQVGSDQRQWGVDYESLTQYLRDYELDTTIKENYGETGHRLVRMMRKVGKLEEKMIPNIAMVKQSEIRIKLAEMQMAGIVDIQEVPRDAGHTNARTIFLWYFDTERVAALYLDKLYKCMSRCFQRLGVEKRRVQEILTALQRQDMKGRKPEDCLEKEPLENYQAFRNSEDLLMTEVARLDGLIGIFQDY